MENQNYADVMGTGTGSTNAPFTASLLPQGSTIPLYHGYGATEEDDQAEDERFETLFYRSTQLPLVSRPRGEAGSEENEIAIASSFSQSTLWHARHDSST